MLAAAASAAESGAAWLRGSVWYWTRWAHVTLFANGTFHAPNLERGQGSWAASGPADGSRVDIMWGAGKLHSMQVSADRRAMHGARWDGEPCVAEFVAAVAPEPTPTVS